MIKSYTYENLVKKPFDELLTLKKIYSEKLTNEKKRLKEKESKSMVRKVQRYIVKHKFIRNILVFLLLIYIGIVLYFLIKLIILFVIQLLIPLISENFFETNLDVTSKVQVTFYLMKLIVVSSPIIVVFVFVDASNQSYKYYDSLKAKLTRIDDVIKNHYKKSLNYKNGERELVLSFLRAILSVAEKKVFIVDTFSDKTPIEILSAVKKHVKIKILTQKPYSNFYNYYSAAKKERKNRIMAKKANRKIHDRHIYVDENCWKLGSSLNSIGNKHGSIDPKKDFQSIYEEDMKIFEQSSESL